MQWANGVGRLVLRYAVVNWDAPRIRTAVGLSALATLLVCASAISSFCALAAASATLIGALVLTVWAVADAMRAGQGSASSRSEPYRTRSPLRHWA